MRFITCVAALALLCGLTEILRADTVHTGRWETANTCFDWVRIDKPNGCFKLITKDCDDPNDCNWKDLGWDCTGAGGSVLPNGELLPSTYDTNGNLVCMVAPGMGGIFSPNQSQQNGVCFAANDGTTLTIAASLLVFFH